MAGGFPAERLAMARRAAHGVGGGSRDLVLNLAYAGFLAATVLGELTALVGRVRARDGQAALVASAAARRQLAAAGLGDLAPFAPSVGAAIRLMRGRAGRSVVYAA
jgi:hypothetical protein